MHDCGSNQLQHRWSDRITGTKERRRENVEGQQGRTHDKNFHGCESIVLVTSLVYESHKPSSQQGHIIRERTGGREEYCNGDESRSERVQFGSKAILSRNYIRRSSQGGDHDREHGCRTAVGSA